MDEKHFENAKLATDHKQLWDLSSLMSNILFNFDVFQGMLANNDCLEAQFNLVNDGVVFISAEHAVTKLNKSAEILFNTTSASAVGKTIADILGSKNNHFMAAIAEVVSKVPFASLIKTTVTMTAGTDKASESTEQQINVNFYASKLLDGQKRLFGYCLVFQPIC